MPGLNNATQDSTGSNVFEFPNPTSPFTHHQQYALESLRQGRSVTAIMEDLRYDRQTFYDWRNANHAFKRATEEARDDFRGVVGDCIHDLQQAVHVLLDDCIRTGSVPLPLRLRSAALFLRYAHSETLLPRRLLALATAPDGISPSSPNAGPSSPTPFPNQNPKPSEPQSAEPQASDAGKPEAGTPTPEAASAPTVLQPQKTDETVRSVRINEAIAQSQPSLDAAQSAPIPAESADRATESCCQGQSESASDARGSQPPILQAPKAAAQNPNPSETAPPSSSLPKNQASAPKASAAANATPEAGSRKPEAVLSQQWLGTHFLHQHESPKAFEKLLANHIGAYQFANAPEELLVFRITQKSWLLRRVETWERVIADSRVAKIREKHPNAAAPACIAMSLLEVKESNQTRFYTRTAKLRKEHEDALDRLTAHLDTLQARRQSNDLRTQRVNPLPASHPHILFAHPATSMSHRRT